MTTLLLGKLGQIAWIYLPLSHRVRSPTRDGVPQLRSLGADAPGSPNAGNVDIERRVVLGRYLLPVDTSSAGRRLRQHALQAFQVAPSDSSFSSGTAGKTNGDVGRFHSVLVLEDGPKRCPSTPATPSGRCLAVFLSIIDPSLTSQIVALPTAPRHARAPPVS